MHSNWSGVFWWGVGIAVLMVLTILYWLSVLADEFLGWIERRINAAFDARYGDW